MLVGPLRLNNSVYIDIGKQVLITVVCLSALITQAQSLGLAFEMRKFIRLEELIC